MDSEQGAHLLTLFHQSLHVFRAADSGSDIRVIRMSRIMPLGTVALQKDALSKTVRIQVNPLYAV